jgi:hypothetical protein
MKLLLSAIVFVLTFALSTRTVASPSESHSEAEAEGHGSEKLFPQPKANLENAKSPGAVELIEPAFFSTVAGQTTLKWKEAADAENYHLQVATDPNYKWLVADEHFYKGTSYELKNLEAGKHYYWRVAATNQSKWAGSTHGYFSKSMFETK